MEEVSTLTRHLDPAEEESEPGLTVFTPVLEGAGREETSGTASRAMTSTLLRWGWTCREEGGLGVGDAGLARPGRSAAVSPRAPGRQPQPADPSVHPEEREEEDARK